MLFMRAVQAACHWILLLIEAGALAWLVALLMALLGWAAWGLGQLGRHIPRETADAHARTAAPQNHNRKHRQVRPQRG